MTEMNDDGKLVAEIEVGGGIAFEARMDDIITSEEDPGGELLEDQRPPESGVMVDTNPEPAAVEEPAGEIQEDPDDGKDPNYDPDPNFKPPTEEPDGDEFADYSEAAVIAQILNSKRPGLFNEVQKDMDWESVLESLDNYVAESLQSGQEYLMNEIGDRAEYVDFLLKGGDPKALQTALSNVQYSKLDLEKATEEQKEEVVKAMYAKTSIPQEEINDIIETAKLKGTLDAKANTAVKYFDKEEKDVLKAAKEQERIDRENYAKYQQQLKQDMETILEGDAIMDLPLDDSERAKLKDFIFNSTELVDVPDGKGGTETRRMTKYQIAEQRYKQSLPMQLAFARLLMNDFKFDSVKQQAANERDKELIDRLNSRAPQRRRKPGAKNAYLDY